MLRQVWTFRKCLQRSAMGLILFGVVASPSIAADRYVIDPTHTYSIFEYSHWGLSLQQGRFEKNSGFIELDLENKTGSVQLDIDAASVSTGNSIFDKALRSGSFFDVEVYPKISFKSTTVQFDEQDNLIGLEGDLTIKNITKRVKFSLTHFRCRFMPLYFKTACGANGNAKILRSDFDVGRYTPFVSDEVTLYFSVEAIKE
jgi:polyisoprenoid-binding protein YceI